MMHSNITMQILSRLMIYWRPIMDFPSLWKKSMTFWLVLGSPLLKCKKASIFFQWPQGGTEEAAEQLLVSCDNSSPNGLYPRSNAWIYIALLYTSSISSFVWNKMLGFCHHLPEKKDIFHMGTYEMWEKMLLLLIIRLWLNKHEKMIPSEYYERLWEMHLSFVILKDFFVSYVFYILR